MRLLVRFLFATAVAAPTAASASTPTARARDPIITSDDDDDTDDVDDEVVEAALASLVTIETPRTAGPRLARLLETMNAFDATRAASVAALSPNVEIRRALADALAVRFHLVGDDFVLDQLLADSDPLVRASATRARQARVGMTVRWPLFRS